MDAGPIGADDHDRPERRAQPARADARLLEIVQNADTALQSSRYSEYFAVHRSL
jgi:hypothetical protein